MIRIKNFAFKKWSQTQWWWCVSNFYLRNYGNKL